MSALAARRAGTAASLVARATGSFGLIPYWLIVLSCRLVLAKGFSSSAETHLANWQTTLYLFTNSYHVPLRPPALTAHIAVADAHPVGLDDARAGGHGAWLVFDRRADPRPDRTGSRRPAGARIFVVFARELRKMQNIGCRNVLAGVIAGGLGAAAGTSHAAGLELAFMLHAVFFSHETHQPKPLDPQVFVADPAAKAGVGPQGIRHVAGFRPTFLADPPEAALFNADGSPLGFTLAAWLAAKGTVRITPEGSGAAIACGCTALRPNGVYGLLENHCD